MNLGIFAKIFEPRPLDELFAAVARAGYASVQFNLTCAELPMLPLEPVPATVVQAIAQAAAKHRIALPAMSGTFNMIHPDRPEIDAGMRGLANVAEVCRQLKIPVITICTGTRDRESMWREHPENTSRAAWRDLVISLQRALEVTASANVSLALEPEPANVVSSAPLARKLIDEVRSPRLGVTLDAANLIRGTSPAEVRAIFDEAFTLLADRVVLAHAKERKADGTVVPAGQGIVDFPHFIAGLQRIGFDGAMIAHGFEEKDAAGVAGFLKPLLAG
jgi:sugar phosphate isomerase/epimerase